MESALIYLFFWLFIYLFIYFSFTQKHSFFCKIFLIVNAFNLVMNINLIDQRLYIENFRSKFSCYVRLLKSMYMCVCVFIQPFGRYMTQGQFLSKVQLVWIQSFPSRLVA